MEPISDDIYSLGFLLDRTFSAMMSRLNRKLEKSGYYIQHSQYIILKKLYVYGEISQTRLAILTRKDQAAINRSVKSLTEKGYISVDSGKGKNKVIKLLPKAIEEREKLIEIGRSTVDECIKGIPESRISYGIRFLHRVYANANKEMTGHRDK